MWWILKLPDSLTHPSGPPKEGVSVILDDLDGMEIESLPIVPNPTIKCRSIQISPPSQTRDPFYASATHRQNQENAAT